MYCNCLQVDQAGTKLKWAVPAEAPVGVPEGVACREFHLAAPLKKGSSAKLSAVAAHTHVLRPEPAEVSQSAVAVCLQDGGWWEREGELCSAAHERRCLA